VSHEETIKEILEQPYHWVLIPDKETGTWFGQIEEFEGCYTQGNTAEEAVRLLRECAELWLEVTLEDGHPIPRPRKEEWDETPEENGSSD
jgi:predicted RNase H-like HicB family nuclease